MPTEIWPTERNLCSPPKFLEQCNQNGSIFCNECHIYSHLEIFYDLRDEFEHIREHVVDIFNIQTFKPLFLYHIPFIIDSLGTFSPITSRFNLLNC